MLNNRAPTALSECIRTRGRARALARLVMAAAACAALFACAKPTELAPTAGGLARGDAARLSLLVTQTRAQHPELTATGLRQGPQQGAGEGAQLAELALRGEGVSLTPGIQVGPREHVRLSLFLDKGHYHTGYVALAVGEAPEEQWRILGYDLRGDVAGDFELLYALADADSRVRYLVVLGGVYEEQGHQWRAFEGTLVVPGKGVRIEGWERIYRVDFGFRHPAAPLHLVDAERSNAQLASLRRAVPALESLTGRIGQARRERDTLAQQAPPPEQAQRHQQDLAKRGESLTRMEEERARALDSAESTLKEYWDLRATIDIEFARFLDSNAFRWRDAAQQQAWFDQWKQVEFHHPRIDELHRGLAGQLADSGPIEQARTNAMAVIERLDNWSRNPSRETQSAPR